MQAKKQREKKERIEAKKKMMAAKKNAAALGANNENDNLVSLWGSMRFVWKMLTFFFICVGIYVPGIVFLLALIRAVAFSLYTGT